MNCWHCNTKLIWGGDHNIENKLFDLLRDGFTLMSIEDTDSRVRKEVKKKRCYEKKSLG
jgi:hypothetical protein